MYAGQGQTNAASGVHDAAEVPTSLRGAQIVREFERLAESIVRPEVSLVIPTLNEEENIPWVLARLPEEVDEVIIVDGRSTDGTVEAALLARADARIVFETRPGKGAALRTGFRAARGEYVVMMDADGSMDPGEITRYVDALRAGGEFVKGSRFMPDGGTSDMTIIRRAGNAALRELVNTLYGRRFTDLCYGYCGFRRTALAELALSADGFEIETEIVVRAAKARLRITEVPSFESPRRHGDSNLSAWRDGCRVLRTLLRERLGEPGPRRRRIVVPEIGEPVALSAMQEVGVAAMAGDDARV